MFAALAMGDALFGGRGFAIADDWHKAGVPVELHVYERGSHGFGMGAPGTTSTNADARIACLAAIAGNPEADTADCACRWVDFAILEAASGVMITGLQGSRSVSRNASPTASRIQDFRRKRLAARATPGARLLHSPRCCPLVTGRGTAWPTDQSDAWCRAAHRIDDVPSRDCRRVPAERYAERLDELISRYASAKWARDRIVQGHW